MEGFRASPTAPIVAGMSDNDPLTNRSDDNRAFDDGRFGNTPVDGEPTEAVASADDDTMENIAESLPGAGTLHGGDEQDTDARRAGSANGTNDSDGLTDNDDPAIPSRPAPLG